jgi:hypothetical protein
MYRSLFGVNFSKVFWGKFFKNRVFGRKFWAILGAIVVFG